MKKIVTIILSLSVMSSCADGLETTLEIDLPKPPDLIQFSSFIFESEEQSTCEVGRILSIDERFSEGYLIEGAEVVLTALDRNESIIFEASESENSIINFNKEIEEDWLVEGEMYQLNISHLEYPTTTATQLLPISTPIKELRFLEDAGLNIVGERSSGIEFTFDDEQGEDHYEVLLFLAIEVDDRTILTNEVFITSTDPSLSYGYGDQSFLIEDDLFDGQEKTVLIKFDEYYIQDKDKLYILFRTISEDHYRFHKTARLASLADNNPFQSPIQVHSNAIDGVGIFSMYSEFRRFVW